MRIMLEQESNRRTTGMDEHQGVQVCVWREKGAHSLESGAFLNQSPLVAIISREIMNLSDSIGQCHSVNKREKYRALREDACAAATTRIVSCGAHRGERRDLPFPKASLERRVS